MLRLPAASTRISTPIDLVLPRRCRVLSWRIRSSFAWEAIDMFEISSRKSVPPLAASSLPAFC